MLSDYALMSFNVLRNWAPDLRDADQEFLENYINSASLKIRDYLGMNIIRKQYTEVHDARKEIKLKQENVTSVASVKYDPARAWTGDTTVTLVDGDDYYWHTGSRVVTLLTLNVPLYYRDSMQIVYTAGKYPLIYDQRLEPAEPVENEVWRDTANLSYKLYDGSSWEVIEEDDVVSNLLLNALTETILYYKQRILRNGVGTRSTQGSSAVSFYQQMELSLPENVKDMLNPQGMLL
jgi:hypothetical protein